MGTVYKRKGSKKWKVAYRDAEGRRRYETGYTDKAATQQLLAKREREAAQGEVGLVDPYAEHRKKPITEHIDAYEAHLRAKGAGKKHIRDVRARLKRTFKGMSCSRYGKLSAKRAEEFLLNLVEVGNASKKTRNQYLTDLRAFTKWGVRARRWGTDPLEHVKPLKGDDDIRRRRRPLTEQELGKLLQAAEVRPVKEYRDKHPNASPEPLRQKLREGQDRALLYRTMAYVGLRVNEARTLTWGALDLDADLPTLTVEAKYAKNKRRDTIPLHPGVAKLLHEQRATIAEERGKMPGADELIFKVGSHPERPFKKDLATAEIDVRDKSGAVVDLHSLRHTCATWLTRAGVIPKVAQYLMRHANLSTTMGIYTHLDLTDMANGVAALPEIEPPTEPSHADSADNEPKDETEERQQIRQHQNDISAQSESTPGNDKGRGETGGVAVSPCPEAEIDPECCSESHDVVEQDLVGVTGLEPAASTSRT